MSGIKSGRGPQPKKIKAAVALKPTKLAKFARRAQMGLSKVRPMPGGGMLPMPDGDQNNDQ